MMKPPKYLTRKEMEALTTHRLLAYRNKLLKAHDGPNWDGSGKEGSKISEGWRGCYRNLKEVLSQREHIKRR